MRFIPDSSTRIQSRLVVTTTLVLAVFLTLAGLVLDRSFAASTLTGAEQQMRLVIYSLLGAAETEGGRVVFPDLPEPRLLQPESGLYAAVSEPGGAFRWRSPSALTTAVEFPERPMPVGEFLFGPDAAAARFVLSYAVIWEDADETALVFQVAADQEPFLAAIQAFRQNLYLGLVLITLLLIGVQIAAIRWGLKPLRIMAHEVRELEEGQRERLSGAYPRELQGLADNLGRFAAHEQRSRTRYRNALEDLAHSLKTPLAVMRNAMSPQPGSARGHASQEESPQPGSARGHASQEKEPQPGSARGHASQEKEPQPGSARGHASQEESPQPGSARGHASQEKDPQPGSARGHASQEKDPQPGSARTLPPEQPALVTEQLDRMESAVTRQLSRATVTGPLVVAKRVDLGSILRRLVRALQTAHKDRAIAVELELAEGLSARGDERDFMDLFGNVLENAFKYTHSRVRVAASAGPRTVVRIEDDGPGIDSEIRGQVIDRGIRADRIQPGQGIGLAVVAELAALYDGSLEIGSSPLGGANVSVTL